MLELKTDPLPDIKPEKETSISIQNREQILKIQDVVDEYLALKNTALENFEEAAITVNGFSMLSSILDNSMVNHFKKLENNEIGFITDKPSGYDLDTIRKCIIIAALNNVKVSGNEFNILQGKFYLTKNGYRGLIFRNPDFEDVMIDVGVPEISSVNRNAIVAVSAQYKFKGKSHKITRKIAVRSNAGATDAAICGKAERSIRKMIWEAHVQTPLNAGDAIEDRPSTRKIQDPIKEQTIDI